MFIFKAKSKVRYLGKSPNLINGSYYIIENNLISKDILLLNLESIEGLYPSIDFEGEIFQIRKTYLK